MSYTELYVLTKDKNYERQDFKNAFRGAMYVWNDIAKRYAGFEMFPMFDLEDQMEVWNYNNRNPGIMSNHEAIVMSSTMDGALVEGNRWKDLSDAFEQYGDEHPNSNFLEQANAIREFVSRLGEDEILAFGWNQTSVNEPWCVQYNDETDDMDVYDPHEQSKHFWVYEGLEE